MQLLQLGGFAPTQTDSYVSATREKISPTMPSLADSSTVRKPKCVVESCEPSPALLLPLPPLLLEPAPASWPTVAACWLTVLQLRRTSHPALAPGHCSAEQAVYARGAFCMLSLTMLLLLLWHAAVTARRSTRDDRERQSCMVLDVWRKVSIHVCNTSDVYPVSARLGIESHFGHQHRKSDHCTMASSSSSSAVGYGSRRPMIQVNHVCALLPTVPYVSLVFFCLALSVCNAQRKQM